MERLTLSFKEADEEQKKSLEKVLKPHHAFRFAFDKRLSAYLSGKISEKKVPNIVSASRTFRSRTSAGKKSSRNESQSSSELTKLKLKHLEQRQRLERKIPKKWKKQQFGKQEKIDKKLELM